MCFEATDQPARLLWVWPSHFIFRLFSPASFDPGVHFHSHNATCLLPQRLCSTKNTSRCCRVLQSVKVGCGGAGAPWHKWQSTDLIWRDSDDKQQACFNVACLDKLIHTVLIFSRGWNKFMLPLVVLFRGYVEYFAHFWCNQTGISM